MKKLLFFITMLISFLMLLTFVYSRPISGNLKITNFSFIIEEDEQAEVFLFGDIFGYLNGTVEISFNISNEIDYYILPKIIVLPESCVGDCDNYFTGYIVDVLSTLYHNGSSIIVLTGSPFNPPDNISYSYSFISGEFKLEDKIGRFASGYIDIKIYEDTGETLQVYDGIEYFDLNMTINGTYTGFLNENRLLIEENKQKISFLENLFNQLNSTVDKIINTICSVHSGGLFSLICGETTTTSTTTTLPSTSCYDYCQDEYTKPGMCRDRCRAGEKYVGIKYCEDSLCCCIIVS